MKKMWGLLTIYPTFTSYKLYVKMILRHKKAHDEVGIRAGRYFEKWINEDGGVIR